MMAAAQIHILAGPNGAGKTTFAREFLPNEARCTSFINADLIAAGLSPFAPKAAAIDAARIMLAQIAAQTRRGKSFALETTLSGRAYAPHIPQWRAAGYQVNLWFLSLPSAEAAITRVKLGSHSSSSPTGDSEQGAWLGSWRLGSQLDVYRVFCIPEGCQPVAGCSLVQAG